MDHRINFGQSHWQCSCGHNQSVGVLDWMTEDAKPLYYHTTGGWSTMPQRVLPMLAILFVLCSCVHEPVILPSGPGGAIEGVDSTGVTFTDQGYELWVSEGVPEAWFTSTPKGYHLTTLQWHEGNAIRVKRVNPVLPLSAQPGASKP
jgi:hypothetical protein